MDLKEDGLVDPNQHWYYLSKANVVSRAIRDRGSNTRPVSDVGAGSGFCARRLLSEQLVDSALCVDPNYESTVSADSRIELSKSLPDGKFDALLLIDVLEHVSDDAALLMDSLACLRPGGIVIIAVPAFKSLWSSHDVYLEHHRRYRLRDVVLLARSANLEVLERRYLFAALFPVAFLARRARRGATKPSSDLKPAPRVVNRALRAGFEVEHRVMRQRVFGLSAMVVARRPPEDR
jgi:SAM-dependent methyltransferase